MRTTMQTLAICGFVMGCLYAMPRAVAGETVTWEYDLTSAGEDVLWLSDTAVSTNEYGYALSYEITSLKALCEYSDVLPPIWVEVSSYLDPEFLAGGDTFIGPPPHVLVQDSVVYPEPPTDPGFAADIELGLDENGYGNVSMTNIIFGDMEVPDIPGFWVTLVGVRLQGTLTVETLDQPTWCLGDMNCSGGAPDFEDITYFAAALGGEVAWQQYYRDQHGGADPTCPWLLGDFSEPANGVEFSDILPFAASIGQPCQPYIP